MRQDDEDDSDEQGAQRDEDEDVPDLKEGLNPEKPSFQHHGSIPRTWQEAIMTEVEKLELCLTMYHGQFVIPYDVMERDCPALFEYYLEIVLQGDTSINPREAYVSCGGVPYGGQGIIRWHFDRLGMWTRGHTLTICVSSIEEPPPLLVRKKRGKSWVASLRSGEASSTFLTNDFSHARKNQGNFLYH